MLGTDVMVIEPPRLIHRQFNNSFSAWRQPNLAHRRLVAMPNDKLDSATHLGEISAETGQHLCRDPVALTRQSQQQVLGSHVGMVEAPRLFLRKAQHRARPLGEFLKFVVHLPSVIPSLRLIGHHALRG